MTKNETDIFGKIELEVVLSKISQTCKSKHLVFSLICRALISYLYLSCPIFIYGERHKGKNEHEKGDLRGLKTVEQEEANKRPCDMKQYE